MIKVNNTYITASVEDIVGLLKTHLSLMGINLLNQIRPGRDNIQVTCPIHNNGQERKPSCGIRTTEEQGKEVGSVHCFTCGYTASLPVFISNCFGKRDGGKYGQKWLLKHFSGIDGVSDRKPIIDLSRGKISQNVDKTYISEEELESYRYIHPYMYKRGLTDEIIEKYDIGYDKNTDCITMPIRDESGRTLFFCRRSVKSKFFSYPEGVEKPIYGIYELPKDCKELVVCESVFNALTCVKYGISAIALLGTGNKYQYEQIKQLPVRKIILGFDGDDAGDRAAIRFAQNVTNKIICKYEIPRGKDINDLTKEEFDGLRKVGV